MRSVAILLAIPLTGCLPYAHDTPRVTSRTIQPPEVERPGALVVHSKRYDGLVVITAGWPRQCRSTVVDHVETTHMREASLVGTRDGDMWGWFVLAPALALAWPVGIADAALTYGAVVATGSSTTARDEPAGKLVERCPAPAAHVGIHLTLPSGARVDATTDERGRFALLLPADEPAGAVAVTADPTAAPTPVVPPVAPPALPAPILARPSPRTPDVTVQPPAAAVARSGLSAVNHAAVVCAARLQLAGIARIQLAVAASGEITSVKTDRGPPLAACLTAELADARFAPSDAPHDVSVPFLLRGPP